MMQEQGLQERIEEGIDPDNVVAKLVAELNQMTFQEREKVSDELHGVEKITVETKELLATSLQEMDHALKGVPNSSIYEKAKRIKPGYVEDPSFRIMFLRSEYYNAERAALRLVKFLQNKVDLFGEETLTRPIYLSDLSDDDIAFVKTGVVQLIQARDRSGRVILADFNMDPSLEQPKDISNYIKTVAYMVLAAAEDEETQKRGLIGLFYFTNAIPVIQKLYERRPKLFDWLPIKLVGVHFCYYNDPVFRLVQALVLLLMGRERRIRVRMHEGSHTECQYKLMTFGVPVSSHHFPVGYENDSLKTAAHAKWIARRMVKETALQSGGGVVGSSFEGIDLPCSRDVLLGRGKTIQNHSGNVILRDLIAEYHPEYRSAPKKEKGYVAWKVVMAIKMLGGRFLRREANGWWVSVPDETACEKIRMTYRTGGPPRSTSGRMHPPRTTTTIMATTPTRSIMTKSDRMMLPPPQVLYTSDISSLSPAFLEPPLKRPRKQEDDGYAAGSRGAESHQVDDEEEAFAPSSGVVDYSSSGATGRGNNKTCTNFCVGV